MSQFIKYASFFNIEHTCLYNDIYYILIWFTIFDVVKKKISSKYHLLIWPHDLYSIAHIDQNRICNNYTLNHVRLFDLNNRNH